ncbi:MAG: hypothetical protein PHX83_16850 [Acidobacteriia bacterium]|nr:hypothetical protein [Terriglobia bacterium]
MEGRWASLKSSRLQEDFARLMQGRTNETQIGACKYHGAENQMRKIESFSGVLKKGGEKFQESAVSSRNAWKLEVCNFTAGKRPVKTFRLPTEDSNTIEVLKGAATKEQSQSWWVCDLTGLVG